MYKTVIYEIVKIEFVKQGGVQVVSLSDAGKTGYHFLRFDKMENMDKGEISVGGRYRVTEMEQGLRIELI